MSLAHKVVVFVVAAVFINNACAVWKNKGVTTKPECGESDFRCDNGECVLSYWQCDGEADCSDGSDEKKDVCDVKKKGCQGFSCLGQFGNHICLANSWVCDGHEDCADGTDELACKHRTCSPEQFSCRSGAGECIPLTWMCDDTPDCSDASDEKSCNVTCRPDEFTCANRKCIQKRWVCDHDNDCEDNSDEQNCTSHSCDPKTEFSCHDKNATCISLRWVCDSDHDCPDGSDEKDCVYGEPKMTAKCTVNEFACSDGMTCIHKSWMCDSDHDCMDGEDESPRYCNESLCREDQFRCHNNLCIPGHLHCTGTPECSDGSDEWNCTGIGYAKCDVATHFDCGGGVCIPWAKVCDNQRDCPDNSDEPGPAVCNKNECSVKNGGCVHNCHDTPNGFYCSCKKGYQLSNDSKTCDDINECETPGVCSQICLNEKGRFKCECVRGYLRDRQDPTRCKAGEGHASLLFARRHDIRKISLDHHDMTSIVNDTSAATALDYVFRTGMIFWSDFRDMKIYKAPIDEGSQRKMVISDDMTTADGLAVDWIYNHLYWTDTKKKTIELANFEGNMRKTVLKDNLYEPRSIAVNPLDGWMYWTDWGKAPKIERGGMDGSHRMAIVTHKVSWPNGLTLDLVGHRIFWVDAKQKLISSCNYDGSERRVVLHSEQYLGHPFSITTFEDYIFWTDWDKKAIFKANKFNGSNVTSISAQMLKTPMAIHVYHPYRQPDGMNYCTAVNGHCSHLCLPAPYFNKESPKYSCACPDGLHLGISGLICIEKTMGVPTTNVTSDVGWSGAESNFNIYTIIICLSVLLVLIALAMVFVYKRYQNRNVTSMNFDNPVYRKTTEDQFALEKSQYQPPRNFPTTNIGEEAQEPLTSPGTSDYV